MKFVAKLLISLSALVVFAAHIVAAATHPMVTEYTNANWWNGARFETGTRYVSDGVFVEKPTVPVDAVVDLQGEFIVPPYADAHNHMPGTIADFNKAALDAGVFYFMNPNSLASGAAATRAYLSRPNRIDAKLSMGGITAPGGHPAKLYQDILIKYVYTDMTPEQMVGDAFHYVTRTEDIEPVIQKLVSQHADFVKIFLLYSEEFDKRKDDPKYRGDRGLDPKLIPAIVKAAHNHGLKVAAHIETTADFRVAVDAGVDEIAHLPGYVALKDPVSKYVISKSDADDAARHHTVVVTTAAYALHTRDPESRLSAVQTMQVSNLSKLMAAGVPILLGTDGNAGDVVKEAQYLVGLHIVGPAQALKLLAEDTPRYIFPERKIGSLSPGYEASFLCLTADPSLDAANLGTLNGYAKRGVLLKLTVGTPQIP